jgi:EAL domain-containing protein (putative c-di-GMP-specific phosphodiesterase class I)
MAINLSGRQIAHDPLVETLQHALDANGLRPADIVMEVEITETVLQSIEQSAEVLRRLHDLGVRIAIDDFGTGYSSLSLLKHLPVDTLKIDRVFIGHLPEDPDGSAITAGMIALAHRLGLRVVAEGVETEGQLAFLRQHGCDCVQGFLLGAALPPEEIERLLRAQ